MAGLNIYLLGPAQAGDNRTVKVYARYRPDDSQPGTERDLGVSPVVLNIGSGPYREDNSVLVSALKSALSAMYPEQVITDEDVVGGRHQSAGLRGLFQGKEWIRL